MYIIIHIAHDNNIILCVHYYTASVSFIGEDQIILYFKSIQNDEFFKKKLIFLFRFVGFLILFFHDNIHF